jgi:cytochrome c oxidase subunit II
MTAVTEAPEHPHEPDPGAERAARIERRWATAATAIIALLVFMAAYGGIHEATMPQLNLEIVNPTTLHLAGEFIEGNLGSAVEPNGSVTVRAVAQQYSFTPQCILVPVDTPVTFRATSADVVHGFLIDGSNVNTMLIPGYISTISVRFATLGDHHMPCHEFCGVGHEGMWGRIKVIDRESFMGMAADQRRLSCVS